ncbi:MAG: nucleotidyltransferase domain-containing protein [Lachnospiraceae bacterium]|nr:nucleotidyltransferase domain-containing protein [Lachnospiraceae bacterium]
MPENVSSIVYRFSQEVKRMLGESLRRIIVYGSYARGDYHENSDVDIMILVKMSDEEIRAVKNDIYDLAFDVEMNTGIQLSPIIKNEAQYEYWVDTLPFYRNVRDEGVIVSG